MAIIPIPKEVTVTVFAAYLFIFTAYAVAMQFRRPDYETNMESVLIMGVLPMTVGLTLFSFGQMTTDGIWIPIYAAATMSLYLLFRRRASGGGESVSVQQKS